MIAPKRAGTAVLKSLKRCWYCPRAFLSSASRKRHHAGKQSAVGGLTAPVAAPGSAVDRAGLPQCAPPRIIDLIDENGDTIASGSEGGRSHGRPALSALDSTAGAPMFPPAMSPPRGETARPAMCAPSAGFAAVGEGGSAAAGVLRQGTTWDVFGM